MATRTQKVKLGIFLVVTMVLALVTLIAFAGLDMFRTKNVFFTLYDESVSGLEVGAQVKLRGVRVGTVTALKLSERDTENVRVIYEVDRDAPVKIDAKAYVKMQGITGLKFLELKGGLGDAPRLPSKSEIPAGEGTLEMVQDRFELVAEKAERVLDALTRVDWAKSVERVDRAIAAAEHLVVTLDKDMGQLAQRLDGVLIRADGVLVQAGQVMQTTGAAVTASSGKVDLLMVDAQSVTHEAKQTMIEIRGLVRNNDEQLRAAVYNLRQATEAFKEFGRALQRRPSLLLFDGPPKERDLP